MQFNKEEIEVIKAALNNTILQLRINCIYCESVFKKDTDNCSAPSCPIKENKKEIESLKEKIEKEKQNDK